MKENEKQLALFNAPNVVVRLKEYITQTGELCEEAEIKLIKLQNLELTKFYISRKYLCDQAELELFNYPDAQAVLNTYIDNGHYFCAAAEIRLFSLPNPENILKKYIQTGVHLSSGAEIQLVELNNKTLFRLYTRRFALALPAQLKLKALERRELFEIYTAEFPSVYISGELYTHAKEKGWV